MAQLTELEALNHILSAVGSGPLAGLDDYRPDGQAAAQHLKEASVWMQAKGWWFNTVYEVRMIPQGVKGHVILPANAMKLVNTYDETTKTQLLITNRYGRAYDMRAKTDRFTNAIISDVLQRLEWELLPAVAQDAALYRAAQMMIIHDLEDYHKASQYDEKTMLALRDMRVEDMEVKRRVDGRYVHLNQLTRRAVGGVRPYYRR